VNEIATGQIPATGQVLPKFVTLVDNHGAIIVGSLSAVTGVIGLLAVAGICILGIRRRRARNKEPKQVKAGVVSHKDQTKIRSRKIGRGSFSASFNGSSLSVGQSLGALEPIESPGYEITPPEGIESRSSPLVFLCYAGKNYETTPVSSVFTPESAPYDMAPPSKFTGTGEISGWAVGNHEYVEIQFKDLIIQNQIGSGS
jgi:hypothetical protein